MWTQKPPLGTQLDKAHPLNKGLVAYWPMNERAGDKINDLSMNRNTGTLLGMSFPPTATSGWNPGRKGTGLNFDGGTDYINCGNKSILNITGYITCTAWVKGAAQLTKAFFSKNDLNAARSWRMGSGTASTNKLSVIISSDGGAVNRKNYESSIVVFDNTFHFVAFTFDKSTLKLYVDGALDTNPTKTTDAAITSIFSSTVNTIIGGDLSTGALNTALAGSIDEPRIYNRALLASEIRQLYAEQYCMFEDE